MISKTSAMNNGFYSKLSSFQHNKNESIHLEYDDEYVSQNLKKASFSVSNNFGEVVKKFKSTFMHN